MVLMTFENSGCRKEDRKLVSLDGAILVAKRKCGIDVRIHDMSERGAKLAIPGDAKLPVMFELLVVAQKKVYPVRICWKRHELIGVEFVGKSYSTSLA